jgi:hypothetical protein
MAGRMLSTSSFSHIIDAPIDRVDIADWLLHLPGPEFRRCSPASHIAYGATTTDDGRTMAISVEVIGRCVLVQQFVREIGEPRHCRMVSTSDVFTVFGRSTTHTVWDLSVEPLDDDSCEYVNHLAATATDEFVAMLTGRGVSFEQVAAACDRAAVAHNAQETALFAASIGRRARARRRGLSAVEHTNG